MRVEAREVHSQSMGVLERIATVVVGGVAEERELVVVATRGAVAALASRGRHRKAVYEVGIRAAGLDAGQPELTAEHIDFVCGHGRTICDLNWM